MARAVSETRGTILVIAAVPYLAKRTRLEKIARVLAQAGLSVAFWGWERVAGESARTAEHGHSTRILLRGGGYSSRGLLFYYPRWMWKVFWATLREKPTLVHALGFESAFPVCLATLLVPRIGYVYDDPDRMSRCYVMPRAARRLLEILERWVSRRSAVHLVPGTSRYDDGLVAPRMAVIQNDPSDQALAASRDIEPVRLPPAALVVYVNGWIGDQRGSAQLDAVAEALSGTPGVRFLAAGRTTGEAAERFIRRPNVTFLGEVDNPVALAQYRASHLVVTYYDPAIEINRYAEPNKWRDCVATGVPFVVNHEVVTAKPYLETGAAFGCGYDDVRGLEALICDLAGDHSRLDAARAALAAMRREQQSFDDQFRAQVLPEVVTWADRRS